MSFSDMTEGGGDKEDCDDLLPDSWDYSNLLAYIRYRDKRKELLKSVHSFGILSILCYYNLTHKALFNCSGY